ncbi:MAG: hypothetical protein AAB428_02305 [Patescibacteria group bacterium]
MKKLRMGATQLLVSYVGFEQRRYILIAGKITELVPRQIFVATKI